jgi:hypothetical protein
VSSRSPRSLAAKAFFLDISGLPLFRMEGQAT